MHHRVVLYIWLLTFIALFIPTRPAAATTHNSQQSITLLSPNNISMTAPTMQQHYTPDWEPHAHQPLVQPMPEEGPMAFLSVVSSAEIVVHGHVAAVDVAWDATGRTIESTATIVVHETLLGKRLLGNGDSVVTVRTSGGFLAAEGIGMLSVHAAQFTEGEELLLFLNKEGINKEGSGWQTVQGAAGKVLIQGETAINPDQQWRTTLRELQDIVQTFAIGGSTGADLTSFYAALHQTDFHAMQQPWRSTGAMVTRKWPAPNPSATFYVNINCSQMTTQQLPEAELRDAIVGAANKWSTVNSADFLLRYGGPSSATATGYNGINEIVFMAKGQNARAAAAEVWYRADMTIVEADIWINDDYKWSVRDTPDATTVDLESALLHEFGHWLILGHITEKTSVMYPQLAVGTVKRNLQMADIAGISAIYPR